MRRSVILFMVFFAAALCSFHPALAAEGDAGEIRREVVEFETYSPDTLNDIYSGRWRVKPVRISGTLYSSEGDEPAPAVVLHHGSGHPERLQPWFDDLTPKLVGAGIAVFVLDSFTGRGITSTGAKQARLSKATRICDAFQALKTLASLPRIDGARVGVSGYSFGGVVAMMSADARLVEAGLADGKKFAAHLPMHPSCQSQFRALKLTGAPMLFLVGELDDYLPPKYCVSYVERMVGEGYNAKIKVYPGAYHAWIVDYGVTYCKRCATFGDCGRIYIEEDGHEVALDGKLSTKDGWPRYIDTLLRTCGKRGATLRMNPEARLDAIEANVEFFSKTLASRK